MSHNLLQSLFLALTTFIGGVINSVAGGGGILVFPSLLGIGLRPVQANATGTVALWPGQFTSIAGYREHLRKNLRVVLPAIIVAAIGGLAGSWTLLHNSQSSFLRIVPFLFLLASTTFALRGPISRMIKARASAHQHSTERIFLLPLLALLLCITYYIGYFGAGAGLLTITALSLCGVEHIVEINALKTVITTVANFVAVIMFVAHRAVDWRFGWFMMITCAIGGYTGARNSRRINDRVLRAVIITLGFSVAIWFFFRNHA